MENMRSVSKWMENNSNKCIVIIVPDLNYMKHIRKEIWIKLGVPSTFDKRKIRTSNNVTLLFPYPDRTDNIKGYSIDVILFHEDMGEIARCNILSNIYQLLKKNYIKGEFRI